MLTSLAESGARSFRIPLGPRVLVRHAEVQAFMPRVNVEGVEVLCSVTTKLWREGGRFGPSLTTARAHKPRQLSFSAGEWMSIEAVGQKAGTCFITPTGHAIKEPTA